jgi:spectinomycin phosphotransferase
MEGHYGLSVAALAFLPVGNDAASWVYRLETGEGQRYFLKLRSKARFNAPSLIVPRYLLEQELPHILAPLPTREQELWVALEDFMLTVYPFVEGRMAAHVGLSAAQWQAFGALVRRVHDCRLPRDLRQQLPVETFVPGQRDLIAALQQASARQRLDDEVRREFADFWREQQEIIDVLVTRAGALGTELRRARAPRVLCHADMHPWNVLVAEDGEFWLIDWDEVVMALRERDLMFVVGGLRVDDGVAAARTAQFLQGYGDVKLNPTALAYYRYARAVEDIAADGDRVFFAPDLGEVSRRAALEGFKSMFATGNIVSMALASPLSGHN